LDADPNFSPAETAIGWMHLNKGRKEEAMEAFNRALKANPKDSRAYLGVGRVYLQRGKRELAMENYTQALKLEQDPEKKSRIMNDLFKEGTTWDV